LGVSAVAQADCLHRAGPVFLGLNGYEITATEAEVVDTMIEVAQGALGHQRLSIWLKDTASRK